MRRGVVAVVGALAAVALAVFLWGALGDWRDRRELEGLRESLRERRAEADACQSGLAREEVSFRDYDRRVDSLRAQVSEYEGLHPEGVPADTYDVYLETFEAYNRSVPAWRMQVDSLRAYWETCREKVDAHNALADSLRLRLEQLGLDGRPES